jgi:hypothetical protein
VSGRTSGRMAPQRVLWEMVQQCRQKGPVTCAELDSLPARLPFQDRDLMA